MNMTGGYEHYKGEFDGRLWVLGNAPSLAWDYHRLEKQFTFGCNFLPYWAGLPFLPDFYGVTQPTDHAGQWEFVNSISDRVPFRFVLSVERPEPWYKGWIWVPKAKIEQGKGWMARDGLAEDPPFPTAATTPLNLGVQMGVYLGFTKLYLLGMEMGEGHVYELPTEPGLASTVMRKPSAMTPFDATRVRRTVDTFKMIRDQLAERGVELVNCTPVGALREGFGYTSAEEILRA